MLEILGIALHGMHQDMVRVERAGMNLANSGTPGYKREITSVRPFSAVADVLRGAPAAASATVSQESVSVHLDPKAGTLRSTGQPLDFALDGDGYFEVMTEGGPAYTRQGNFTIDARGRLTTAQGHAVMGVDGEIQLAGVTAEVDANGDVWDRSAQAVGPSSRPVARLKVIRFERSELLRRLGEGLVTASAAPALTGFPAVQVKQGFLENSNVSSVQEMVQLMQSVRHFESLQRAAQGYDDMIGLAIRKLGDL